MSSVSIKLCEGKYELTQHADYTMTAKRHGEPWDRDLTGDKLSAAMFDEIVRLRLVVAEVHSWAVCSAIATPADMAQNFPRIVEITTPEDA